MKFQTADTIEIHSQEFEMEHTNLSVHMDQILQSQPKNQMTMSCFMTPITLFSTYNIRFEPLRQFITHLDSAPCQSASMSPHVDSKSPEKAECKQRLMSKTYAQHESSDHALGHGYILNLRTSVQPPQKLLTNQGFVLVSVIGSTETLALFALGFAILGQIRKSGQIPKSSRQARTGEYKVNTITCMLQQTPNIYVHVMGLENPVHSDYTLHPQLTLECITSMSFMGYSQHTYKPTKCWSCTFLQVRFDPTGIL